MISKTTLKFYLLPAILLVVIIIIYIIATLPGRSKPNNPAVITPTSSTNKPYLSPTPYILVTPTKIPVQNFTGAEINQTLPPELKNLGEQKTTLRRLTPLTLPVGMIDFDYENDRFTLTLKEPKNESEATFDLWLKQTYPAIPKEQFAIR